MEVLKKVDKGKARVTESPPETFESAGTDVDSRPGPSNMKPLAAEEKALRDVPPEVYETTKTPVISRMVFSGKDASEEEQQQQQKPPPKKRGRPRKDEGEGGPLSKKGKMQKVEDGGEGKGSTGTKPSRQAKRSSRSTAIKGRTRKKADSPPDTGDEGEEESPPSETKASGLNTRKHQRRKLDDGSEDEKWDESDGDEPSSNPSHVRLESIPPEGVIIRKKNGIVERLLPPATCVQSRCLR